ncbi:hypothetical protein, partial [Pseudomonas syringae]|uniref:hypothetical protein n=1 Tax=Pseudomonas syringae TaxID=317 RepID=UPI001F415FE3
VSHVLKKGRIRQGSWWSARNFITAFSKKLTPFVERITVASLRFMRQTLSFFGLIPLATRAWRH